MKFGREHGVVITRRRKGHCRLITNMLRWSEISVSLVLCCGRPGLAKWSFTKWVGREDGRFRGCAYGMHSCGIISESCDALAACRMAACGYASPCPCRTIYRPSPLRRSPSHQPYVELLLTRRATRWVFSLQRLKIVPPLLLHVYQREFPRPPASAD